MITIDKLRNLYACLQSDHFMASASNGLLSRAVWLHYRHTRQDRYIEVLPVKIVTYYMKRILERVDKWTAISVSTDTDQ